MSVGCVSGAATWPEAAEFCLSLISDDGEYGRMYSLDGRGEIDILAPPIDGPIPPEGQRGNIIVPVSFPTLDQAQRAGKLLADAFAAVRAIEAETPPDPSECEHVAPPRRFARDLKKWRVCELCAANLGEEPR